MTTVLCAADLAVYRLATNTLPVNADGTIGEAPDDATVARFVLNLGHAGNVRTHTLKAFSEDEYRKIIGAL